MTRRSQGKRRATEADIRQQFAATSAEIVRHREKLKLSHADLAAKMQSTEAFVRDVEMGDKDLTLSELQRFAVALECTVADLVPPLTEETRAFARDFEAADEPVRNALSSLLRALSNEGKNGGDAHS